MLKPHRYPLLDKESGGDPPPSGAGDDAPPPAPPVGAFRPPEGAPPAPPSSAPPGEPPPDDGRPEWAPAKFWDAEGKALKAEELARSYGELERRFRGGVDLPPKDADGYVFEKVDGEDFDLDAEQDALFRQAALERGLNNGQYNWIVREYQDGLREARATFWTANEQATLEALTKEHGEKAAQVSADAWKTAAHYLSAEELQALQRAPSSPVVMNLLARIAPELKPDDPPPNSAGAPGSFESRTQAAIALRRDLKSAFWDGTKPGHKAAVAQVDAWQEECRQHGVRSEDLIRAN